MAHPGEDIIWAQPAGRKRRYLGWDVCLQAQDKALVFCKGDAISGELAQAMGQASQAINDLAAQAQNLSRLIEDMKHA